VRKPRPELPPLVEQLRVLLWFQTHLTLLGLLIVISFVGYVTNVRHVRIDDEVGNQILVMMGLLVAIAVVLAVCARLVRNRWFWVYPLILVAEAGVVVVIVRAVASGLAGGLLVLLYAALTGWILADLARHEVRAHLFRLRG
jgi:cell division protein FtsW (lipid II flippase)